MVGKHRLSVAIYILILAVVASIAVLIFSTLPYKTVLLMASVLVILLGLMVALLAWTLHEDEKMEKEQHDQRLIISSLIEMRKKEIVKK